MSTTTLRERLEAASLVQAVDSRFKYAEKNCIGYGGMGVVYEERVQENDGVVVQKVSLITGEHIYPYPQKGIIPLKSVVYENDLGWGTIVFQREGVSYVDIYSLMHADFYALKHAVYEYQNLRSVKGIDYFQQVVEDVLYTTESGVEVKADREFFILDGQLCLRTMMTKVPGYSLDYLISEHVSVEMRLNPKDVVKIGYDIAGALKFLGKEKHIVHRDVKLANIVYDVFKEENNTSVFGAGHAYLIDFGNSMRVEKGLEDVSLLEDIALLLKKDHGSMFSGTAGYISPEIILRKAVTEQSDIWSLGCSLFFLMTGKMPFSSDAQGARFMLAGREGLRRTLYDFSSYNSDLIEGVCRMFAREPEERSLDYFVQEAERVLAGEKSFLRSENVFISADIHDDCTAAYADTFPQPFFHDQTTGQL